MKRRTNRHLMPLICACVTLCLTLVCPPAFSKSIDLRPDGPLRTRTQHPIYLQFLSMPMESPQTLNRDQFETSIETSFSNIFEFDNLANTTINIDMELYRTALNFTYGLSDRMDIKIELPFLSTTGGFLDDFIEGYHDAFGFPDSGRDLVPRDVHNFTVVRNGRVLANYPASSFGLSDITVRLKYLISDHFDWPFKLALAPYLKLPTGQVTQGFSSEHFDFGLSLLFQKDLKRFHLTSHLGYVIIGGHNQLNPIIGHGFLSFGQSLRYQIINGLSVIAQLNGNTSAFKDVDTRDLKEIVLDLNVGLAGEFLLKNAVFDEFFYQFSFSEDILSSGPSVDFSLLFMAGFRY